MVKLQKEIVMDTEYHDILTFSKAFWNLTPADLRFFTISMIKTDFRSRLNLEDVYRYIEEHGGFRIIFHRPHILSQGCASAFYAEHNAQHDEKNTAENREDSKFLESLLKTMSSGQIEFMFLGHEPVNGIPCHELWRKFTGPTDPADGDEDMLRKYFYRKAYPEDINFDLFHSGNGSTNGFHGPRTIEELAREAGLLITDMLLETVTCRARLQLEGWF